MTKETAMHIAARVWCDQDFETYTMDTDAALEIADIILHVAKKQEKWHTSSPAINKYTEIGED